MNTYFVLAFIPSHVVTILICFDCKSGIFCKSEIHAARRWVGFIHIRWADLICQTLQNIFLSNIFKASWDQVKRETISDIWLETLVGQNSSWAKKAKNMIQQVLWKYLDFSIAFAEYLSKLSYKLSIMQSLKESRLNCLKGSLISILLGK